MKSKYRGPKLAHLVGQGESWLEREQSAASVAHQVEFGIGGGWQGKVAPW